MSPSLDQPRSGTRFSWVVVALACVSCRSYNARTAGALHDFRAGRLEKAHEAYDGGGVTGSPFLANAEAGMVSLAAGDWERALADLGEAAAAVRATEDEALVSPENAGELLLSWTLSESFTEYHGEGYERVMLHAALALTYLARNMVEDAMVELRRSNALLETEQQLYEKEYLAGGLGHFLSAVCYELLREPNDAYIDYKRLEAKGLAPQLVGPSLVRLARGLGFDEDATRWTALYGEGEPLEPDAARIVVVAGVGLGPYKQDATLTIPTPDGLIQWSVPQFQQREQPIPFVELEAVGEGGRLRTVVVEDVARVARVNLDDRMLWLSAKSAVRAAIKYGVTDYLGDKHGSFARAVGAFLTHVTERADLRAWQTLPDTWQVARLFVDPGVHRLVVHAPGAASIDFGDYYLEAGETMFVYVRTIDLSLYAHPVGGVPVEPGTHPLATILTFPTKEPSPMKTLPVLTLCLALSAGCSSIRYADPTEEETVNIDWGSTDLQTFSRHMTQSLLDSPGLSYMSHPGKDDDLRIVTYMGGISNETDEHINTKDLMRKIRADLMQSNKFRFVAGDQGQTEIGDQVRFQQGSGRVDPEQAKAFGKQLGADAVIYGSLSSIKKRKGRSLESGLSQVKDAYYLFVLEMVNIETGEIVWADQEEINKEARVSFFGSD